MVPISVLVNPRNVGFYQFIPLWANDDKFYYRHPHHHTGAGSFRRHEPLKDHLWWQAVTCWGGFNGIIASIVDQCDIAEMFRTVSIYLERYDPHSVLTARLEEPNYFTFARRIP
jgi:hypothetical protein